MSARSGADLLRPVSGSSVLRHHRHVRYTELLGVAILCRVDTKAVSALSPGAAAAWARFDGRTPLSAIGPGRDLLELARRLRAIGALTDVAPDDRPGPGDAEPDDLMPGASMPEVTLHASWTPIDERPGVVVQLDDDAAADGDDRRARTVAVAIGPDQITVATRPIVRIVASDGDRLREPLEAMRAFERLVDAVDTDQLTQPGCLDALAEIVERVPVLGEPAANLDDPRPAFVSRLGEAS